MARRFNILALLVIASMMLASCGADATPTTQPASDTPTTMAGAAPTAMAGETPSAMTGETPTAMTVETPTQAMMGETPTEAMTGTTPAAGGATMDKNNPPAVPNATEAKKYTGAAITYYGGQVGIDHDLDVILADKFNKDTGIKINIVQRSADPAVDFATYTRFFQAKSTDIDVMMLDVIWPGAFAQHLADLSSKLGDTAKQHYPGIIANDTVGGKLIAMPWFSDFGILYYRTDLMKKYGFSAPPKTWDELQQQAQKIMDGEKAANPNFTGFVFQGKASEGLTCDALEWVASNGGGTFVEDGKVTINNPKAADILTKAKGWVGTISPKAVTTYGEEEARTAFQGGNAAFMRNWPYAYGLAKNPDKEGKMSPIADKFDVAPLPHGTDPSDKSVGTVGGWALGVSVYSKNQDAAIEWVRYVTSAEVQTWRGVVGSFVPTIPSVAADPQVQAAEPFLKNLADVERVSRPSGVLKGNYNQGSTAIFQGVNQVLNGGDVNSQLSTIESTLKRLGGQ